jgi:uncharacterized protein YozE (UPF0346 family)
VRSVGVAYWIAYKCIVDWTRQLILKAIMSGIFERFAEHVYGKKEHTNLIDAIWDDPGFPWHDIETMSEYVHKTYRPRVSTEFDVFFDEFDRMMTCESSCSDTTDTEDDTLNGLLQDETWCDDEKEHV